MAGIEQFVQRQNGFYSPQKDILNPGPRLMFHFLSEFARIPHPSGGERQIREFLISIAEGTGWSYEKDPVGNLLIEIPGTAGYEKAPGVIFQSHMDIKSVKKDDYPFEPAVAGVTTVLDENGQWLSGYKTNLGGDNDDGSALGLALAMDRTLVHGPLALMFTVQEERGLVGASNMAFKNDLSRYQYLVNWDSEEFGEGNIGCAGAGDNQITLKVERESKPDGMDYCAIKVEGCQGGHSGVGMDSGHVNAIKLLAQALDVIQQEKLDMRLAGIEGGIGRGNIPESALAVIAANPSTVDQINVLLQRILSDTKSKYPLEDKMSITVTPSVQPLIGDQKMVRVLTKEFTEEAVALINSLPFGPERYSREFPEVVETSNNPALIKTEKDRLEISAVTRSLNDPDLSRWGQTIKKTAEHFGASAPHSLTYRAWAPDVSAPINKIVADVFRERFGKEIKLGPIHAGLECGVIRNEKYPHLQVIALPAATIKGPHTTREKSDLYSLLKSYSFAGCLVKHIAQSRYTQILFNRLSQRLKHR